MSNITSVDSIARKGRFPTSSGESFGGQYVAPSLLPILDRLDHEFTVASSDPVFIAKFEELLIDNIGRPTALMRLEKIGGGQVFLKREDLTNSGGSFGAAVLGQCLLAQRMGFQEVVADTGSGDHGVALASIASRLRLEATIYIADSASRSQTSMVDRMRAFGATVILVPGEAAMLHHAMSGAIQHWMGHGDTCLYIAGGPIGPHPYPDMVRHFQSVIGREVRSQIQARLGSLPTALVAAMDGGSAAVGLFAPFVDDPVRLLIAEPGGTGGSESGAALSHGSPGILHGAYTLLLQDGDGQLRDVGSLAPGMSYPAAGPQLAAWSRKERLEVVQIPDIEALSTMRAIAADHGVLVSLEAAFGLALAQRVARPLTSEDAVVCTVSAGGTKDISHMGDA
jgi:tryptophan synthase beta chain